MKAPSDLDAEKAVLGCLLSGSGDLDLARTISPAEFHAPAHQRIFEGMLALAAVGQPIDTLTLADRLKAAGHLAEVGGPAYLMVLDSAVTVGANFKAYLSIVQDRARRRAIIENARQIAGKASNLGEDANAAALAGSAALAKIGSASATELETLEHALGDLLDDLDAIAKGTKQAVLETGIDVWDELCGGLPMGRLTLIGAYPSVGKSALKNRMVLNLARAGTKCGVFELEDPRSALARRFVAADSGVAVAKLARERLNEYQLAATGDAIKRAYSWAGNCVIDNRSGLTAAQIAATARQMVVQRGCQAIFIDHAGEMGLTAGMGRHDLDVSHAVRLIRDVAKDLNVAVVMLVHFHRPKTSTDKEPRFIRPNSAMWKNSGGFEEAARLAVGLWLDEDAPGGVVGTILKQTEGEKDLDFWMPLDGASALIESRGGRKRAQDTGYTKGRNE